MDIYRPQEDADDLEQGVEEVRVQLDHLEAEEKAKRQRKPGEPVFEHDLESARATDWHDELELQDDHPYILGRQVSIELEAALEQEEQQLEDSESRRPPQGLGINNQWPHCSAAAVPTTDRQWVRFASQLGITVSEDRLEGSLLFECVLYCLLLVLHYCCTGCHNHDSDAPTSWCQLGSLRPLAVQGSAQPGADTAGQASDGLEQPCGLAQEHQGSLLLPH